MENSACGHDRLGVIVVVINDVPVEAITVNAADGFAGSASTGNARRIDQFQTLSLAAVVQMRLERSQARRFEQHRIAIHAHIFGIRRNVEIFVVTHVCNLFNVFGNVTFRVEPDSHRYVDGSIFTIGVQVNIHDGPRAGFDETASAFRENIAKLADRVLFQQSLFFVPLFVFKACLGNGVMNCLRAFEGLHFHRLNVAVGFQAEVFHGKVSPIIRCPGFNDYFVLKRHHYIRFADVPAVAVVKLAGRGQYGGVTLRRARIHPLRDQTDFLIGQ